MNPRIDFLDYKEVNPMITKQKKKKTNETDDSV